MNLYRLSAFPKNNEGGNMAGVCLNADHLTTKDMLKIARDIGYSETAFVLDSKVADFKLRFFTPLKEVDLCGHATIATFNLLKQMDIVRKGTYIQETRAGVLKIMIQKDKVFMEQKPPIYSEIIDKAEVADLFLSNSFVDDNFPIVILSTGLREIFIPIVSKEDMDNLVPNFDKIIKISKKYNCIGVHVFSFDDEVDAYCRNFAPLVGIDEESATGTSSGALGCYLNKYKDKFKTKYVFRQGYTMGKPSEIEVELTLDNGSIRKVYVGGKAIQINE